MDPGQKLPQFYPLGDAAIVIQFEQEISEETNAKIRIIGMHLEENSFPWLISYVPAFADITIYYRSWMITYPKLKDMLTSMLISLLDERSKQTSPIKKISVVYGAEYGPDLDIVAGHTGLSAEEVVHRHSSATYLVHMIGFMPGFPYLGGMDASLAAPRKERPRAKVDAGAVGIAGQQTGVYPLESPGGWQIIGRAAEKLFDIHRNPPALLKAGDRVSFVPVSEAEFLDIRNKTTQRAQHQDAPVLSPVVHTSGGIRIIRGGLLSTIQDTGRTGYRKDGITGSGAMDLLALRLANILLGNPEGAAALECTLSGPELEFEGNHLIVITGADLSPKINNEPADMWKPLKVSTGDRLTFGAPVFGCRAYLQLAGGIDVPEVLGSRSTHLKAGFGGWNGRMLKRGDIIPVAAAGKVLMPQKFKWYPDPLIYPMDIDKAIRIIKGPEFDLFTEQSILDLFTAVFHIGQASDRMGYRLSGPELNLRDQKEMLSSGLSFGTIQVTSEGQPILLMADHQTTGGYPRIANVATVDLPRLAQMQPGHQITFELITLAEAQLLYHQMELKLRQLKQTITFKYNNHV